MTEPLHWGTPQLHHTLRADGWISTRWEGWPTGLSQRRKPEPIDFFDILEEARIVTARVFEEYWQHAYGPGCRRCWWMWPCSEKKRLKAAWHDAMAGGEELRLRIRAESAMAGYGPDANRSTSNNDLTTEPK